MASQVEVARLASVSQSAVSRILNGRAKEFGIPEETVTRVRHAAAALNYQPNLGAQMLRGRQTKLIGVVVRSFEDRFLATLLDELNTRALQSGYVLIVVGFKHGEYNLQEIRLLQSYRPDAFVVIGSTEFSGWSQDFLNSGKLIIQIGVPVDDPRIVTCGSDELAASRLLVEHLLELGHRRIGMVGDRTPASRIRMSHLKSVLSEKGGSISVPCLYASERESIAAGADAAGYLLDTVPRALWPTAMVVTGDMIALSMMRKLVERAVRIPAELSLASFGDVDSASLVSPSLTTIRQPARDIAAISIQIITSGLPQASVMLPPTLMARESTSAPRA